LNKSKFKTLSLVIFCLYLFWGCFSDHSSDSVQSGTRSTEPSPQQNQSVQPPTAPTQDAIKPGEVLEEDLSSQAQVSSSIVSPVMIRQVQAWLNILHFKAGPPDGRMGDKTVQAIKAYQKSRKMTIDGLVTEALLERLHGEIEKKH
jgi:peptidoglycan hydrolase-like protein with peptidoglycan-binding domain